MDTEIGYKVVKPDGGKLKSCFAPAAGMVYYEKDKWTNRPEGCGPLALFDDRTKAFCWANNHFLYGLQIWKCEYVPSKVLALWAENGEYTDCMVEVPTGTVFAESIKLLNGEGG